MIEPTEYHISRFSSIKVMKDDGRVISYEVYNKDPTDFGSYNAAKTAALELKNHYLSIGG